MTDLLVNLLALAGAAFTLVAAIGMVRLPHVLWRMHAAAKAGTLGAGLLLGSVAVSAPAAAASRSVAAIVFLLLTAPVAAHMLARHAGVMPSRGSGSARNDKGAA